MRRILIALSLFAFVVQAGDETKPPSKDKAPKKEESKKDEAKRHPKYAPGFTLKDPDGKDRTLDEFAGKWIVLEWINHGCPYVKKHYQTGNMQALQKKYTGKDVVWLSICSSAPGLQGHQTPAEWRKTNESLGVKATTVLLDADGKVGRLYHARTTPQMCIINPKRIKVYEGAIDDQRSWKPDSVKDAKNYVSLVLDAAMAGKEIPVSETKPYGCSVKYARQQ